MQKKQHAAHTEVRIFKLSRNSPPFTGTQCHSALHKQNLHPILIQLNPLYTHKPQFFVQNVGTQEIQVLPSVWKTRCGLESCRYWVWAILRGQDKNDGKLTSSHLYYHLCDYSLLLGLLYLLWIFFSYFMFLLFLM